MNHKIEINIDDVTKLFSLAEKKKHEIFDIIIHVLKKENKVKNLIYRSFIKFLEEDFPDGNIVHNYDETYKKYFEKCFNYHKEEILSNFPNQTETEIYNKLYDDLKDI